MNTMTEKVPLKSKVWLSFADSMCATLAGLVLGGGMSYFYTKYMGLGEGLAGIVWLLFGIWNAFNDPLFGYISDRTKSKLGRRIPYIRYGSVFYAAIFIVTWVRFPFGGSQAAMFAQMLVTLFLFDALYTAIATALYVMPFEMAVSNKARSGIFVWKIAFGVLSLAAPLVIFPLLKPDVGEDATRFQLIMAGIGAAAFAVIFFSTFFYKEKGYIKQQEQYPLFKSIAACFRNRSFLLFEVISFSVIFIQTILLQGVIYYFDEFTVPMTLCYAALLLGAGGGMVLWITGREKLGVRKCALLMCTIAGFGALTMMSLGAHTVFAVTAFLAVGVGFAGGMYLIPIINGDVMDYDESVTGLRREGMYAGVNSFITKPAISLANAAFLMVLKWFGYNQELGAGAQSPQAKTGILVAWMAIPACLLMLSFIAMRFYPLDGEDWNATKRHLEQKHLQKEEEYIKSLTGTNDATAGE